ncbi:hypothetical protein ACXHMN_31710 [Rhizobium sp. LEGMi12c]
MAKYPEIVIAITPFIFQLGVRMIWQKDRHILPAGSLAEAVV